MKFSDCSSPRVILGNSHPLIKARNCRQCKENSYVCDHRDNFWTRAYRNKLYSSFCSETRKKSVSRELQKCLGQAQGL